uniref:SHR-BD domain-containing protein n=1 Tax=Globodera pallida TaxID=36090 RepID=A0A183BWB9_GLOPA
MPNLFLITFGLIALFPALFVLSSAFECPESAAAAIDVRDAAKKDEKVPIRLQKLRLLSLDVNKRPFCDAEGRSAIQLPGFLHILSGELHLLQALPFPLLKENGTSLRLALMLEQNSVWVGRICDRGRSQSAFLSDQFCTLSLCFVLPEVCESLEAMAFKFAGGAFPMVLPLSDLFPTDQPIPLEPALQFPLLEGFWKAEAEIQLQLSADGEEWLDNDIDADEHKVLARIGTQNWHFVTMGDDSHEEL